jgi:hypothetical protein
MRDVIIVAERRCHASSGGSSPPMAASRARISSRHAESSATRSME